MNIRVNNIYLTPTHADHTPYLLATDLNKKASLCTRNTALVNRITSVEPIVMDLVNGIAHWVHGHVDVLLFNPPYVVTPTEEIGSHGLAASWAGGVYGREVTDRLLPFIPNLLSKNGCFYLVVIPENRPEELVEWFRVRGFRTEILMTRKAGRELLSILKFTREIGFVAGKN